MQDAKLSEDAAKIPKKECRRCGHCCQPYFSLYVSDDDEAKWRAERREDILKQLRFEREHIIWKDDQPVNLSTGETERRCHWLKKTPDNTTLCSIHETKPKICNDYTPGGSELCVQYRRVRDFIIGLDLHGTLLEPGEKFPDELVVPVAQELDRLKSKALLWLCTGNDLSFVEKKVPEPVLDMLDGYVLETGCSVSRDKHTEEVIATAEEVKTIKDLEKMLKQMNFPELDYFAYRLTTISMFTKEPRNFFHRVKAVVDRTEFQSRVAITYSSVAVDILPRGYDKYRGLYAVSEGRKTIGVADSANDLNLLLRSDYAFAPSNFARELEPVLAEKGRKVVELPHLTSMEQNILALACQPETKGVLEILRFIANHL
jgi:hydroxymethylpyrimidine pyrophosphatase-like HAD family hydrolase